jgi:hypothetical protein
MGSLSFARWIALGVFASFAALPACSDTPKCTQGETRTCSCGSGLGAEVCSNGAFGACDCGNLVQPDGGKPVTAGYCDRSIATTKVQLMVTPQPQLCMEWCWATTASMVLQYYGLAVTQCGIASATINTQCCPAQCNVPGCDMGGTPAPALQAFGLYYRQIARALTPVEIQSEISNGRPIIVYFNGQSTGGQFAHFIVLSGFDPQAATFHIIDPLNLYQPGATYTQPYIADLSYKQLFDGPDAYSPWVMSIASISPRPDGCSPVVNPTCACTK